MKKHFFQYPIKLKKLVVAAALFIGNSVIAQSPTAPAQGFNVFVNNGASFYTSETEGPVAIGGDLTIGGSYGVATHNNFSYKYKNINIGLLVAGKVNYNSGSSFQVLNNGYVLIGNQNGSKAWYLDQNNAASPIRITPNTNYNSSPNISLSASSPNLGVSATVNPIFQASPINFGTAFTTLQSSSSSLSTLSDNTTIYNSPNQNSVAIPHKNIPSNSQIYLKTLNTGINVLNIAGSDLNNFTSLTYSGQTPDANHVLVVNVNASGSFTWNAFTNGGISGTNAAYVLYNFYNTTSLNIAGYGAVEGTVFAPFASISKSSNNSNIEGQVIGQSYAQTAGGEIHSYNFTTSITVGPSAPSITSSALSFNNIDIKDISSTWTIGNGSNRLVIVSSSPITTLPINGVTYTANTAFGSGSSLAGGYVVYNGSGNSVVVTGLTAKTPYYFAVIEYNGAGASTMYATASLSGTATTLADTDADGVADIYDAYPTDPLRAYNNYYPATGFGTYMFEDNWPGTGDFDFNDMVIGYKYNTVTNAQNQAVELKATLVTRAVGATFPNGFALQLDSLSPQLITGVTGTKTHNAPWLSLNSNGTEANQTYANVIVVDNEALVMPPNPSGFVNTLQSDPYTTPDTTNLTISFAQNTVNPSSFQINPYIIINKDRGRELHLANRIPTSKANPAYFGSNDDRSVPSQGSYYKNAKNIPWALDIPANVPYSVEYIDITKTYLFLANWAQSNGATYTDWFSNTAPGYRNTATLYVH